MNSEFLSFLDAIKLSPSERQDAKKKYDGVCKKLHEHYYPDTTYTGSTKFLIGSYGKKTHIRPARDVDVIFVMPPEKFTRYDDNNSNCQSQLLQDVKSILSKKYPNTPIKAFGKVVVLEFSDPQHNIEVQPAWENSDGTFKIPNSESGGSWENVNPRAEIQTIKQSNDITGKTRDLIRIVKKWSEQSSINVKSYNIERCVLNFITVEHRDKDYSEVVKDLFGYYKMLSGGQLESHLSTAYKRASKACEYETNGNHQKVTEEWRKIFGNSFPSSTSKSIDSIEAEITRLNSLYPSSEEQFIDIDLGFPMKINPDYQIKIDTYVTKVKGFRPGRLSDLVKAFDLFKLLKKISVKFEVVKCEVPEPYRLFWKIRNYGEEAKSVKGLRGEITEDSGYKEKKESTLYYGTHLVECYVIKDGNCVAVGRIFVPIGDETNEL